MRRKNELSRKTAFTECKDHGNQSKGSDETSESDHVGKGISTKESLKIFLKNLPKNYKHALSRGKTTSSLCFDSLTYHVVAIQKYRGRESVWTGMSIVSR